jgi:hypothetical protein
MPGSISKNGKRNNDDPPVMYVGQFVDGYITGYG